MTFPRHTPETARRNRLLAALSAPDLDGLMAVLDPMPLPFKLIVIQPNEPIEYVYFPTEGIVSLTGSGDEERSVEVATVGNEGMVGLAAFLKVKTTPLTAIVQIEGSAVRMRVAALEEQLENGSGLDGILRRYTQALLTQIAQSVVCNRLHSLDERLARWLLMSHDRVPVNELPLTQEFMSVMLGVGRPRVTETAARLQAAGLIRHRRGSVTILDRRGLEEVACECYGIVQRSYDQLFGTRTS
jgi:CRP-like cAMP-binding protein